MSINRQGEPSTDLAKTNPAPLLELKPGKTFLPGMAYGLPQGSLALQIKVQDGTQINTQRLHQAFSSLIGAEPTPVGDPANAGAIVNALAWAVVALQRQLKVPVNDHFIVEPRPSNTSSAGFFEVIVPATHPDAAMMTVEFAIRWINALATSPTEAGFDFADLAALGKRLEPHRVAGVNIFSIIDAAFRQGIPVYALAGSAMRLGTGHLQRWMSSTITDQTSAISVGIARQKTATAKLLRSLGLPGAVHSQVRSPDEAVAAAHTLGYPVVIKPADAEQGRGVAADLRNDDDLRVAFKEAAQVSHQILVEKWQEGFTHRMTVVRGELLRVSKRIAGGVHGDGEKTITQLVEDLKHSPDYLRRARLLRKSPLSLDAEALGLLAQNGLSASSVPAPREYIRLRRKDNVNAGGTSEVCSLDTIHPDNVLLALDAASALKLDFAGIDLIMRDITRSWREIGGLICEVNAQPQIVTPESPHFYDRLLTDLFPSGARIKLHLAIIPDRPIDLGPIIQRLIDKPGCNAVSHRSGIWIDGRQRSTPLTNDYLAGLALANHPAVLGGTCLMSLGTIVQAGFPIDSWDQVELIGLEQPSPAEVLQLDLVNKRIRLR